MAQGNPGGRVRLARWLLRMATRLAWRIGGKVALGRWLLEQAVATERATLQTAAGPEGVGGDAPDGGGAADPFGTQIQIAIADSLSRRAEQLRWLIEETVRAWEADNFPRVEALLRWAIRKEIGLAYLLERQAEKIELATTGAAVTR